MSPEFKPFQTFISTTRINRVERNYFKNIQLKHLHLSLGFLNIDEILAKGSTIDHCYIPIFIDQNRSKILPKEIKHFWTDLCVHDSVLQSAL